MHRLQLWSFSLQKTLDLCLNRVQVQVLRLEGYVSRVGRSIVCASCASSIKTLSALIKGLYEYDEPISCDPINCSSSAALSALTRGLCE